MQITNNLSSNLFTSYALQKKEINKESQMTSRFVNVEADKTNEVELVTRSQTDALQSQIAQIKKEYLESRNENVLDVMGTSYNPLKSLHEVEQQYPMYVQAAYAVFRDTDMSVHGWDYTSAEHHRYYDYWGNMTHQYTNDDFKNAINSIEQVVTQLLEQEFEKDPTSDDTNILLLFKAQIQAMPEVFEQAKQQDTNKYESVISGELHKLSKIATRLGNINLEFKEQLNDSVRIVFDYYHSSFHDAFNLVDPTESEEALKEFVANFSSRIALADNTETLLNLTSDSANLNTSTKESKTYESFIDRIRAKLKTTDDSILQKVMSGKTANQAKAAEASA